MRAIKWALMLGCVTGLAELVLWRLYLLAFTGVAPIRIGEVGFAQGTFSRTAVGHSDVIIVPRWLLVIVLVVAILGAALLMYVLVCSYERRRGPERARETSEIPLDAMLFFGVLLISAGLPVGAAIGAQMGTLKHACRIAALLGASGFALIHIWRTRQELPTMGHKVGAYGSITSPPMMLVELAVPG